MSTHNMPCSIERRKSSKIILNLQLRDFFQGTQDEFETAVVNEPSVFEPLKFYCTEITMKRISFTFAHELYCYLPKLDSA